MRTCCDCNEEINTTDARNERTCAVCNGALHGECSMLGLDEVDNCERCLALEQKGFEDAMKTNRQEGIISPGVEL